MSVSNPHGCVTGTSGSLAQLVEHSAVNRRVIGSSPIRTASVQNATFNRSLCRASFLWKGTMKKKIISAKAAAIMLGCSYQMVRERLKKGIWTFGRAIPPNDTHRYYIYEVYSDQLMEYLKGE